MFQLSDQKVQLFIKVVGNQHEKKREHFKKGSPELKKLGLPTPTVMCYATTLHQLSIKIGCDCVIQY